jgi:hypothetical protein
MGRLRQKSTTKQRKADQQEVAAWEANAHAWLLRVEREGEALLHEHPWGGRPTGRFFFPNETVCAALPELTRRVAEEHAKLQAQQCYSPPRESALLAPTTECDDPNDFCLYRLNIEKCTDCGACADAADCEHCTACGACDIPF